MNASRKCIMLAALSLPITCWAQPLIMPLKASSWFVQWPSNNVLPSNNANGNLTFPFPETPLAVWSESEPLIGYLVTRYRQPLAQYKTLTLELQMPLTGVPNFIVDSATPGSIPPSVRPYIERLGDRGTSAYQYYRWWANPISYQLSFGSPGTVTLIVPLTPDQWSSVYGVFGNANPIATAGFYATLATPMMLGITFGGGGAFSHGVQIQSGTGTAQFTILAYRFD